jgi:hypothetical protein
LNSVLASEAQLYFERGDPFYRLMQRIGLIRGEGPDVPRRIVAFLVLTWLPLLVLASLEGRALGLTPRESFLLDFATYARFFVCVPLLIGAEIIIGPRLTINAQHFLRAGLLRTDDFPAFDEAAARVARRRESLTAEAVLVCLALVGAWGSYHSIYAGGEATWHVVATGSGHRFSLAGLWYNAVAIPLLQFLFYRWLWRLTIWTGFLWDMSRLNLKLVVTHPDQAGGLGFLGDAQLPFGLLSAAMGSVLSAEAAFRIVFEGAQISSFKLPFAAYLILSEVLFLGPLLVFLPLLSRARREGLWTYSALTNRYNQSFHEKWAEGRAPTDEQLLGSSDIQSLADLGNSFDMIRAMKPFPFRIQDILRMAVLAALPVLPVVPLAIPVAEIMKILAKMLM